MAANTRKKRSRSASSKPEGDLTVEDLAEQVESLPKQKRILESSALPDYFANSKPHRSFEAPLYNLKPLRNWDGVRSSPAQYKSLVHEHSLQFGKWAKYLEYGFNVLLYGVGSKIELLNSFFLHLQEYPTYRVKAFAYHPSFSVRKLLAKLQTIIAKEFEHSCNQDASLTDMLSATIEGLDYCFKNDQNFSITILIHSLDAPNLKTEDAQQKISKLASHPCIRLVASADHVHLARLWSLSVLAQFNFVSFAVPTYEPYSLETSFSKESLRFFSKHSADSALQGLKHVIQSMTTTQHLVLKALVEICQEQAKTQVSVKELFQSCKNDFIVTTEKQLMDYLLESRDHQVLAEKRTQRGERTLVLLYPLEALGQILNVQGVNGRGPR